MINSIIFSNLVLPPAAPPGLSAFLVFFPPQPYFLLNSRGATLIKAIIYLLTSGACSLVTLILNGGLLITHRTGDVMTVGSGSLVRGLDWMVPSPWTDDLTHPQDGVTAVPWMI